MTQISNPDFESKHARGKGGKFAKMDRDETDIDVNSDSDEVRFQIMQMAGRVRRNTRNVDNLTPRVTVAEWMDKTGVKAAPDDNGNMVYSYTQRNGVEKELTVNNFFEDDPKTLMNEYLNGRAKIINGQSFDDWCDESEYYPDEDMEQEYNLLKKQGEALRSFMDDDSTESEISAHKWCKDMGVTSYDGPQFNEKTFERTTGSGKAVSMSIEGDFDSDADALVQAADRHQAIQGMTREEWLESEGLDDDGEGELAYDRECKFAARVDSFMGNDAAAYIVAGEEF